MTQVPNTITQRVNFYACHRVIDKHNNVYFVPRFDSINEIDKSVSEAYLNRLTFEFDDTDYMNISIGTWSPEDRNLVVKGNIEDFRNRGDDTSMPLNYFIIKRTSTYSDYSTETYYAYFIKRVRQVGNGSISIDYEPDHFTNTFYLQNYHRLTQEEITNKSYEPFSEIITNPYIAQQHYDRVERVGQVGIRNKNMDIFANIEQQFNFRRQYKDSKKQIGNCHLLNDSQLQIIEDTDDFVDLPDEIKIACYQQSTAFLHVVLKDKQVIMRKLIGDEPIERVFNYNIPNTNIQNDLYVLVLPIVSIPRFLEKYESKIKNASYLRKRGNYFVEGKNYTMEQLSLKDFYQKDNPFQNYVLSMFITRDSNLYYNITFNANGFHIVNCQEHSSDDNAKLVIVSAEEGMFSEKLFYTETIEDNEIKIAFKKAVTHPEPFPTTYDDDDTKIPRTAYIEKFGERSFNLDLSKNTTINQLKTEYFEHVLHFEPYSFYSISYLGTIETILNRKNYYHQNESAVNITYSMSISDSIKYNVIPNYVILGERRLMYNESLQFIVTNHLTIINQAIDDYLIANQSQMRAQYALNEIQQKQNWANAGIDAISSIGSGALRGAMFGGPVGAVIGAGAGAIQAGAGLAKQGVEAGLSKKKIDIEQKAKLSDLGRQPDSINKVGAEIITDLSTGEMAFYLNHYTIDKVSYDSIAKYLERYGYQVNIYDKMNILDRKYWNYIELLSMDIDNTISMEAEESIRDIFKSGVTLQHEANGLTYPHNYETILD